MVTVKARVNHGRWIADCPNCRGGAEFAISGQMFVCLSEWLARATPDVADRVLDPRGAILRARTAAAQAGESYEIEWPLEKELIELVLASRPMENQNWSPDETLDDLQRENDAHGITE